MAIISKKLTALAVGSVFLVGAALAANATASVTISATVQTDTSVSFVGGNPAIDFGSDLTSAKIFSGDYSLATDPETAANMSVTDTTTGENVSLVITPTTTAGVNANGGYIQNTTAPGVKLYVQFSATSCSNTTNPAQTVLFTPNGTTNLKSTGGTGGANNGEFTSGVISPDTCNTSATPAGVLGNLKVGLTPAIQQTVAGSYAGTFVIEAIPQ